MITYGCWQAATTILCLLLVCGLHNSEAKKVQSPIPSPSFSAGREYKFQYDAQTASGYAPWISTQSAVGRIQAKVTLTFMTGMEALIQMQECRMGQLNNLFLSQQPWNPGKLYPIDIFESTNVHGERFVEKLELPVRFSYEDGIVSNIRFREEDQPWSKNIKKAVLNMLQLNLKPKQEREQNEAKVDQELRKTQMDDMEGGYDERQMTFTLTEIGIEGECETTYTVTSVQEGYTNVTKSVNFDNCKTVADVAYGMQADEQIYFRKQHFVQKDLLQNVPPQMPKMNNKSVVDKQLLDRSTIIRYTLREDGEDDKPKKKMWSKEGDCNVKNVELMSSYVLKGMDAESSQAMQTIAMARLRFIKATSLDKNTKKQHGGGGDFERAEPETLLYTAELESREALFYMFGDDSHTFSQRGLAESFKPFPMNYPDSDQKIKKVVSLVHQVASTRSDQFPDAENKPIRVTEEISELTKILRFCTEKEIHEIIHKVSSSDEAEIWVYNALAAAGTRNTLKVLVDKIVERSKRKELDEARASQLMNIIGGGSGLPAPSDRIADQLLRLCKDDLVQGQFFLKQTSWLAFGSVVHEVQQMSNRANMVDSVLKAEMILPSNKLELYKRTLSEQLRATSNNVYERVVAIKAIGNSGVEALLEELKDVAEDEKESTIVRINAIEAMRRMNPQKVRLILFPIYQNTMELDDVRMTAFQMIVDSLRAPSKYIVDQIALTMNKEPSRQLRSFVFSKLKALAVSPIFTHQKIAGHLFTALRLVNIDEDQMEAEERASTFKRRAIYSHLHKEGVFIDTTSMFMGKTVSGSPIPTHMALSINTLFNGDLERDRFKISICQNNGEKALRKLFGIKDSESKDRDEEEQSDDDHEEDDNSKGLFSKILSKISDKLGLSGSRNYEESTKKEREPMTMISIRTRNVDTFVIPIGDDVPLEKKEGMKSVWSMLSDLVKARFGKSGLHLEIAGIMGWNERSARVPTSVGMQLKMKRTSMKFGKMNVRLNMEGMSQLNTEFSVIATTSHIQKMKVWSTPLHGAGVKRIATAEVRLPLHATIQALTENGGQRSFKFGIKIPQQQTRLLSIHTLPMTFVTETDTNGRDQLAHGERVKAVSNKQLESRMRKFQHTFFKDSIRLPLKIQGSIHKPRFGALKEVVKSIFASENHLIVDFVPIQSESPFELTLKFTADLHRKGLFERIVQNLKDMVTREEDRVKNAMDRIRSKINIFRSVQSNKPSDSTKSKNSVQIPSGYSMEKAFHQTFKVESEIVGGNLRRRTELDIENFCDPVLQVCETTMQFQRSPFFGGETGQWTANARLMAVYPHIVFGIEELLHQREKNRDLMCSAEIDWGMAKEPQRQSIKMAIKGELSREMSRRTLSPFIEPHAIVQALRPKVQTPFLDMFSVIIDYNLRPLAEKIVSRYFELLKAHYYWNAQEFGNDMDPMEVSMGQHSKKEIAFQLNLEPLCAGSRQHANITIQTPSQVVRLESLEIPKICPMPLLRRTPIVRPISLSPKLLLPFPLIYDTQSKGECTVWSNKISTFDGSEYSVPLSDCYTVIAKDCYFADAGQKSPRFAILMKKSQNGQKKMKIITKNQVIEVQPDPSEPRKLTLKINNERYSSEEVRKQDKPEFKGISFTGNVHGAETMVVESPQFMVRLNGKAARVHLEEKNRQTVCGLCGDYDDNSHNDFRKPDGEFAGRLSEFHKSYTIEDNEEDGCSSESQQKFFKEKFSSEKHNEHHMDADKGHHRRLARMTPFDDVRRKQNRPVKTKPAERTIMEELRDQICFTKLPTKQCPSGTRPDRTTMKEIKLQFACYLRIDPTVVGFKEDVLSNRVIKNSKLLHHQTSYVERVFVPERCFKNYYLQSPLHPHLYSLDKFQDQDMLDTTITDERNSHDFVKASPRRIWEVEYPEEAEISPDRL